MYVYVWHGVVDRSQHVSIFHIKKRKSNIVTVTTLSLEALKVASSIAINNPMTPDSQIYDCFIPM